MKDIERITRAHCASDHVANEMPVITGMNTTRLTNQANDSRARYYETFDVSRSQISIACRPTLQVMYCSFMKLCIICCHAVVVVISSFVRR